MKPIRADFAEEHEFFRSYPLTEDVLQSKKFPGLLVKFHLISVDWSAIANPEDRWFYMPTQGIGRFGCFIPDTCLQKVLNAEEWSNVKQATKELSYRPKHQPVIGTHGEAENYSHCHLEFWIDNECVVTEKEEKGNREIVSPAFQKAVRQMATRHIRFKHSASGQWETSK